MIAAKVAILHHDLEDTEKKLHHAMTENGIPNHLVDIRHNNANDLSEYRVVINRVYASVSSRDFQSVIKCQKLIAELEPKGIRCINGALATHADYDKYLSYQKMADHHVSTPYTYLLPWRSLPSALQEVEKFVSAHPFPIILKTNLGGRGANIFKLNNLLEAQAVFEHITRNPDQYHDRDWIIQEFVQSSIDHDIKISIAFGEYAWSYARSFVSTKASEDPWIASHDLGSSICSYQPTPEEIAVAIAATKAIEADINTVDMVVGSNGPVVIENNTTPQYFHENAKGLEKLTELLYQEVKKAL